MDENLPFPFRRIPPELAVRDVIGQIDPAVLRSSRHHAHQPLLCGQQGIDGK